MQEQEMLAGIRSMLNGTVNQKSQMLKDIKMKMKTVENDIIRNLNELKEFMDEKDFAQNVHNQIEMLWRLMEKVIESQTEHSVERFISKYKSNSAMNILEEFIIALDNRNQNPIVLAMERNVLDSRKILEHYTHFLSQMIFKVLAIEGFYYGVADNHKNGCVDHLHAISKDFDHAMSSFRGFVGGYKLNADRGPDLIATADLLKAKLEGIYTRDVFSIYVWNSTDEHQGHHFYYSVDPAKFEDISLSEKILPGKVHSYKVYGDGSWQGAVVLRSVQFHDIPAETKALVRTSFRTYAVAQHMMFTVLGIQHNKQLNGFSYFNRREEFFPEAYKTHGFAAYNITPVARFTNNGSAVLQEDYSHLIPVYHALTWV